MGISDNVEKYKLQRVKHHEKESITKIDKNNIYNNF